MKVIDYQAALEAKITFELQELARLDERREVALSRLDKYRRALYRELYDLDVDGLEFPAYDGWDGQEHGLREE